MSNIIRRRSSGDVGGFVGLEVSVTTQLVSRLRDGKWDAIVDGVRRLSKCV